MRYAFGDFVLDDQLFELFRAGERLPAQRKTLEVLLYLVKNPDRAVPKEELLERVWPGVTVSGPALAQAMLTVRRALGDDGEEQRFIRTVRGRGYRFVEPVRTEAEGAPAAPGALFGRAETMAALRARLGAAKSGRGSVVLLAGERGMGKTRVAEELGAEARAAGMRVLVARCADGDGASAMWPWLEIVRALHEADGARGPMPEIDLAAQGEYRAFDAIVRVLLEASRATPLVLVLDDLHAADVPSVLLLRFAARRIEDARVLIVGTYRDAGAVLARALGALAQADPKAVLRLRPLDGAEVAQLSRSILGESPTPDVLARVFAKTAGNPLLVTQLVYAMASTEWLVPPDQLSTSTLLGEDSIREAIALHVEAVSEPCNRILGIASVFGTEFALGPLSAAGGATPAEVAAILDEALASGVLARARAGVYRFRHVLVRDVLYKKLPEHARLELHGAAARALLAHGAAAEQPSAAQIAHHFVEAAPREGAADALLWSVRGAARAIERGAHAEAHAMLDRALGVLGVARVDGPRRAEIAALVAELPGDDVDTRERAARLASALGGGE